jgi:hypothetical protein
LQGSFCARRLKTAILHAKWQFARLILRAQVKNCNPARHMAICKAHSARASSKLQSCTRNGNLQGSFCARRLKTPILHAKWQFARLILRAQLQNCNPAREMGVCKAHSARAG